MKVLKRIRMNYLSIKERVTSETNERYKLNVVQVYASTFSYSDNEVDKFYEGIHSDVNRVLTHHTVIMGDFYADLGKHVAGKTTLCKDGVD